MLALGEPLIAHIPELAAQMVVEFSISPAEIDRMTCRDLIAWHTLLVDYQMKKAKLLKRPS